MGVLQNFALKKSTKIISFEILEWCSKYFTDSINNKEDFERKILRALRGYIENTPKFNLICPDYSSYKLTEWQEIYAFIVIRSVFFDLSYDPFIATSKNAQYIGELALKELENWAGKIIDRSPGFTFSE